MCWRRAEVEVKSRSEGGVPHWTRIRARRRCLRARKRLDRKENKSFTAFLAGVVGRLRERSPSCLWLLCVTGLLLPGNPPTSPLQWRQVRSMHLPATMTSTPLLMTLVARLCRAPMLKRALMCCAPPSLTVPSTCSDTGRPTTARPDPWPDPAWPKTSCFAFHHNQSYQTQASNTWLLAPPQAANWQVANKGSGQEWVQVQFPRHTVIMKRINTVKTLLRNSSVFGLVLATLGRSNHFPVKIPQVYT